ncbi:MAG: hypothetical protein KatS3mg119_0510 [Rhodothalassiaceae bacterium]|nr:MAG: hypothetical protein KatS3mg119_0510 [Rhodothalassiaceae bacterium]
MERRKPPFDAASFANLGAPHLVYIKPILLPDGRRNFAIHAANGTPLGVTEDLAAALVELRSRELEPVSLH